VFGNRTGAYRFRQRSTWFRVGAILVGLLPFLLFEFVLMGIGWEPPDSVADPYVGFTELRPLFKLDQSKTQFEIASNRFPLFCPDGFSAVKSKDEFRIFCVGGSTVQGRPFAIETSFPTWLELRLKAIDPSKDWNAINCGGVSYASYRLAPIVEEIVNYQPDLIVLYTGHNEFLEDRTYADVKTTSPWVARTHERMSSIRTYSFLRSLVVRETDSSELEKLPANVEARLDFRNGLSQYKRDLQWRENIANHFEHNLRRMVKAAIEADVPIVVCNPIANLADASPFKSESGAGLTADEVQRFEKAWQEVPSGESISDWRAEIERLKPLLKLNPQHAELRYRIGQAYHQIGEIELAKEHLLAAKEEDICPLRIIEPMYESIRRVVTDYDVALVDVKSFFESRVPDGIVGSESMLDHVHPTIHGHQLIAKLLEEEMSRLDMVRKTASSSESETEAIRASFESHLASLPFMYFELGKDRLAGLKRWAEGRVTREKTK
jgi:lysophospholipase L1-like esterase